MSIHGEILTGKTDQRTACRVPIHLSVETGDDATGPAGILHWRSENLSSSGLCLKPLPGNPLPLAGGVYRVGQSISLEFSLPGQEGRLKTAGCIRWLDLCLDDANRERVFCAGISFEHLGGSNQQAVNQLITGLLRRPQNY